MSKSGRRILRKKNTAFDIAGQFGSCIYILLKRVFIQSPRLQVVSHQ